MKLSTFVSIAVALVDVQPSLSEEHLRGVASVGDHPMPSPDGPQGKEGDETCGCYDLYKHKCSCKKDVCSKKGCENQNMDAWSFLTKDQQYYWTGGCSCGCDGLKVGDDCPEKPPHLEEDDADVKRAAAAAVAADGPVSSNVGSVGDHPMPSPDLPQGKEGDESCGCYDLDKHKCSCKKDVCSKKGCENQNMDAWSFLTKDQQYYWTGGCSCGCDGLEVGDDCPEKPPHLEEDDADVKRAAAAAVAADGPVSSNMSD